MLSNKILLIIVSLVTIICIGLSAVWFVKSEIETKRIVTTKKEQTFSTNKVPSNTTPNSIEDISDKVVDINDIVQISDNKNIVELSAYKNRNSLLFLEKDDLNYKLYGADIDEYSNLKPPNLLYSGVIAKDTKGIWGLLTGLTFDCALFFSDIEKEESLILHNFTTSKKDTISPSLKNFTSNVILGGLDDTIIYARNNITTSELEVISQKIYSEPVEILFSQKYSIKEDIPYIKWIDISSDYTKFLYCLEDNVTKKNVLWFIDLTNKVPSKLTNDDESILTAKFSKEGTKIVFSSQDTVGFSNIYYFNLETNKRIQLTKGNNKYISPDWLYYDNKVVFISKENDFGILNVLETKD